MCIPKFFELDSFCSCSVKRLCCRGLLAQQQDKSQQAEERFEKLSQTMIDPSDQTTTNELEIMCFFEIKT